MPEPDRAQPPFAAGAVPSLSPPPVQGAGLLGLVSAHAAETAPPAVVALGESVRERFGERARAVLFYGSCRRANREDGLVDLYVLVDDYRAAYGRALPAIANRLLAPNVYYLERSFEGRTVRAKYSVVSVRQFERGTAGWFHPYLWARFAQPCTLLYAADEAVAARVRRALARAVETFAGETLPQLPDEFDAATLWTRGLALSYAAELRSERPSGIRALHAHSAEHLAGLTRAVAAGRGWTAAGAGRYRNPVGRAARHAGAWRWRARRLQGKALSVARLLKASFTFDGGIAYVAWKIERHTGVKVPITPFMQRFPRVGAMGAFFRTWRRGGFR